MLFYCVIRDDYVIEAGAWHCHRTDKETQRKDVRHRHRRRRRQTSFKRLKKTVTVASNIVSVFSY